MADAESSIRIAVRPHAGSDTQRTLDAISARPEFSPTDATIGPLDPQAQGVAQGDLLIEIWDMPYPTGSTDYASLAWSITHELRATGAFTEVEADIPVTAFDPRIRGVGAFSRDDCRGREDARDPRWPAEAIEWDEARKLLEELGLDESAIRIGHPDSGFTDHPALGIEAVDRDRDWDVISDDDDATDPMRPPKRWFFNPLPNPGHGTSTGSVIAGRGHEGFVGIAPKASLVPFRATESVVQLFDSDVAKSVRRAIRTGCHIVSMSLGGTGFFNLRDAIQEAVDSGMIVMAAAGNQVRIVTAPAYYDNCLAVAATGPGDAPWDGSSRGSAVDVAAPGNCVWAALFNWDQDPVQPRVERSNGTSYAVAHLAGCAALWLARWGHDHLLKEYGGLVQAAFLHLIRNGACDVPPGWDEDRWGAGRINARKLLSMDLPDKGELEGVGAFGAVDDPVSRLAALSSTDDQRVLAWIERRKKNDDDTHEFARKYEGELAYLLMEDPRVLISLQEPEAMGAFGDIVPDAASPQLAAIFF